MLILAQKFESWLDKMASYLIDEIIKPRVQKLAGKTFLTLVGKLAMFFVNSNKAICEWQSPAFSY